MREFPSLPKWPNREGKRPENPPKSVKGVALRSALALGALFAAERAYHYAEPSTSTAETASSASSGDWSEGRRRLEERRARQLAELGMPVPAYGLEPAPPTDDWDLQEAARREAEARQAREAALSAPITDARIVDLTGRTEGENMVYDHEVEVYFGRPGAFVREVEARLRPQLRADDRAMAAVDQARDALNRVLVEEATEAEASRDLPRALNLLDLAGKDDQIANIAIRERRPGLAMDVWRNGARERLGVPGEDPVGFQLAEQIFAHAEPGTEGEFFRQLSRTERQEAVRYLLERLAYQGRDIDDARASLAEADQNDPPLSASAMAYLEDQLRRLQDEYARTQAALRVLRS